MKNRFLIIICLGVMLIALTSCVKAINISGDKVAFEAIKDAAFVEFIFTPPEHPILPLAPAGLYASKAYSVKAELLELHKDRIDKFYLTLGEGLQRDLNMKVLYGSSLFESDAYKRLNSNGIATYEPLTNFEKFPELAIPAGSFNFIDFSDTKNPYHPFNSPNNNAFFKRNRDNIAKLSKALDVDAVIIGTVTVVTAGVTFYAHGTRYVNVTLVFFDKNGDVIMSGYANSKIKTFELASGSHIPNYVINMDRFATAADSLSSGLK